MYPKDFGIEKECQERVKTKLEFSHKGAKTPATKSTAEELLSDKDPGCISDIKCQVP